mmetsp:Transcript_26269/g.37651  ORF Transcript_26269/g.37651 Transcript_26269/m.37651 type:complete len:217 (+) Transcript_26269:118-768(+)
MEDLIDQSITVCDYMLDPASPRIPRTLLSKCAGVAIFHSVSAAAFVSASAANGILLRRDDGFDEWSPPSAISMHNVGVGITFGLKKSDIIMVLMDDTAVQVLSGDKQVQIGANMSVVAGPTEWAVDQDVAINSSKQGSGLTYCYSLSEGAFAGFSLETGVLSARKQINSDFYKSEASPNVILFARGAVSFPEGSRVPELHKKLNMMERGVVSAPKV